MWTFSEHTGKIHPNIFQKFEFSVENSDRFRKNSSIFGNKLGWIFGKIFGWIFQDLLGRVIIVCHKSSAENLGFIIKTFFCFKLFSKKIHDFENSLKWNFDKNFERANTFEFHFDFSIRIKFYFRRSVSKMEILEFWNFSVRHF